MIPYEIANIVMNVILISTFIGIFFFSYASMIEEKIVKVRTKQIILDLTNSLHVLTPPNILQDMNSKLSKYLIPPNLDKENEEVEVNNKILLKKSMKVLGAVFTIGLAIVIVLSIVYKFPLKDIITKNLILLCFVALTEFSFLTFFAQYYITVDANFVKHKILEVLINYGKS
jgi:uncharacterized membrane protein